MASTSKGIPVSIADKDKNKSWGMSDSEIELIKLEFNEILSLSTANTEANSLWSPDYFYKLIKLIKMEEEKSRQDSNYISIYKDEYVIDVGKDGKERLLIKGKDGEYKEFVHWEDIFDICWKTHIKYCHPTTETLKNIMQHSEYLINDSAIENIREVCYTCSGVKKPYYRLSLDLLPMNSFPDFAFTHIMICQDMLTGFVHLRPLSIDNKESEICMELLRIFMDFGPPKVVHISSNIFYVALDQIKHLTTFAPIPIVIVKVNPDVKKLNRIRNTIYVRIKKNDFENWGIACYGLQLHLNNESPESGEEPPFDKVFTKLESRVIEVLPEIAEGIDKWVSTESEVDNALSFVSGGEGAEQGSPDTSSSEEALAGTEIEFKATSDDEMMQLEEDDPLAIDEHLNL